MRLFRGILVACLLAILGTAVYQTLLWRRFAETEVGRLEGEDQEIALIEPATSIDDWGRIVSACKLIKKEWAKTNPKLPELLVDDDNAFPGRSADVPEIRLGFKSSPQQSLRLRWYKISGEHNVESWVEKLHARGRMPLAIIGGATSDRALRLGKALQEKYPDPERSSPILLITTATAEKASADGPPLIAQYKDRSFRFSFTNQRMVKALLRFVEQTPDLWANKTPERASIAGAAASMAGVGEFLHSWGVLSGYPQLQPYAMHLVSWEDERYSKDLTELFEREFKARNPLSAVFNEGSIAHSVGGFFQPSPLEQNAVDTFIGPRVITPHSLLVLPTQMVRMRRFLINLRQRSPTTARNLVILNGDSISFNAVYRDRDVVWNILDLPYSLVFFTHRDPIAESAGFPRKKDAEMNRASPDRTTTSTSDMLLFRDILEATLYAVLDDGRLLNDVMKMSERMRATSWYHPEHSGTTPFVGNSRLHGLGDRHRFLFDVKGDRRVFTGEHVVWVKPIYDQDRVDGTSRISIWKRVREIEGGAWERVEEFEATYNAQRLGGALP